jgi:hypothetical protein
VLTVHKYPLPPPGTRALALPDGARFLHAGLQDGAAFLWALVDDAAEGEPYTVLVCETGQELALEFLALAYGGLLAGTRYGRPYVRHVFVDARLVPAGGRL